MAKRIAWQEVERKFRTGSNSIKEIAAEFGISESSIKRKLKLESWQRDCGAAKGEVPNAGAKVGKLRLVTSALISPLSETKVRGNVAFDLSSQDAHKEIILAQRRDILRSRALVMALLQELEQQTGYLELLNDFSAGITDSDEKARDKRNDLLQKLTSHAGRTSTMKTLVDSLRLLVALEREAFGIDAKQKNSSSIEDWLEVVNHDA